MRSGTDPRRSGTDPRRSGTDPRRSGTDPRRSGTDPRRPKRSEADAGLSPVCEVAVDSDRTSTTTTHTAHRGQTRGPVADAPGPWASPRRLARGDRAKQVGD